MENPLYDEMADGPQPIMIGHFIESEREGECVYCGRLTLIQTGTTTVNGFPVAGFEFEDCSCGEFLR